MAEFFNKTVNKSNTVADPELIFGKLIVLDERSQCNLCCYETFLTMSTDHNLCNSVT